MILLLILSTTTLSFTNIVLVLTSIFCDSPILSINRSLRFCLCLFDVETMPRIAINFPGWRTSECPAPTGSSASLENETSESQTKVRRQDGVARLRIKGYQLSDIMQWRCKRNS